MLPGATGLHRTRTVPFPCAPAHTRVYQLRTGRARASVAAPLKG